MTPQTFSFRRQCVLLVLFCSAITIAASAGMRPSHAEKAMVASVHSLATDAGVEVMRNGGDARDAGGFPPPPFGRRTPPRGAPRWGGALVTPKSRAQTHPPPPPRQK